MNNILRIAGILYVLLSGLLLPGHAQEREIRLQITDEQGNPLYGVYVHDPVSHILYTTSDEQGICIFAAPEQATIQISCLGHESHSVAAGKLPKDGKIRLQSKTIYLDEAKVEGIEPERILEKAAASLTHHKKKTMFKYYGNGQYEKITECRGRAVEYRREYGCYFSRGICKRMDVLDLNGEDQFVPAYVKRTYSLSVDGKDTLVPMMVTAAEDDRAEYQAESEKVYIVMRAVSLYGPLFAKLKYYEFRPLQDSVDHVFAFQTKADAYPDKSYIFGKGIIRIDRESYRLKSMTFENLDYQFYRLYRNRNWHPKTPFASQVELTFDYDRQGVCHIRSCILTTTWLHFNGKGYLTGEPPSRRNPGKNQLVEKEAFLCQSFEHIPEEVIDKIQNVCLYAGEKRKGEYKAEVWQNIPELLDSRKALAELEQFMNLETQFRRMSNRSYYPEIKYEEGFPRAYRFIDTYQEYMLKCFFKNIP